MKQRRKKILALAAGGAAALAAVVFALGALDRALENTAGALDENAEEKDLARMALDLALRSYAEFIKSITATE